MTHPSQSELDRIVRAEHIDPHSILGPHLEDGAIAFRAFRPRASALDVVWEGRARAMKRIHDAGIFELVEIGEARPAPSDYQLEERCGTETLLFHDAYAFWPTHGDLDLHLVGEGTHRGLWRKLGAHTRVHEGVHGTAFSVWAPSALGVGVLGDFNDWEPRSHTMRRLGPGVWEIFIPAVGEGALYKFGVHGADGLLHVKADPFGRAMQLRPNSASRVFVSHHRWGDGMWLAERAERDQAASPMAIYEVHLGSWKHHAGAARDQGQPNWLSYRELAEELVAYTADMGFTHVELLPVMEHPYDGSWGYQVGGYFAPSSRYGTPDDFRFFVDRCHQAGIGVIVDWVGAHFPKDSFALGRFDGTALYEHIDPRQGEHKQWGTYVFNYDRREVKNFLIESALYWIEELHVDGLRADAVASMLYLDYAAERPEDWVPNQLGGRENVGAIDLLRELDDAVHQRHPGAMVIAEESTSWPGVTHATRAGGLGFDFKWNMGWMHDTLDYFAKDPIHRSFHHHLLTFGLMYAFSERFVLPLSHDEVVHMKGSLLGKMAGDRWRMFANLRALYAHMWAHPGKKLLFMGGEIGQWREWSEARPLDWDLLQHPEHQGVQRLVCDLNRLYRAHPALWEADHEPAGFRWIDCNDNRQSVIAYLRFPRRRDRDEGYLVCVGNFTPVPRYGYRIGVPRSVRHAEILNSDAHEYGGSGMGNLGAVEVSDVPAHGFGQSLLLTLPPLAVLWLVPEEG